MERNIYVLIDSSGSFTECGKDFLQMQLVDSIVNAVESGTIYCPFNIKFMLWNEKISEYSPYDAIDFYGKSDINVLNTFLMEIEENSIVFFMSDGNFNSDVITISQNLVENNKILIAFSVGADSNDCNLENISTNNAVYPSVNLLREIKNILREMLY